MDALQTPVLVVYSTTGTPHATAQESIYETGRGGRGEIMTVEGAMQKTGLLMAVAMVSADMRNIVFPRSLPQWCKYADSLHSVTMPLSFSGRCGSHLDADLLRQLCSCHGCTKHQQSKMLKYGNR